MKNKTTNTNTKFFQYKKVSTGVSVASSGTYTVRKMINGKKIYKTFTNKAKAIKYYNSL